MNLKNNHANPIGISYLNGQFNGTMMLMYKFCNLFLLTVNY